MGGLALAWLFLGFADVTSLSLHPFYRRCLARTFAVRRGPDGAVRYDDAEPTWLHLYGRTTNGPKFVFACSAAISGPDKPAPGLNAVSFVMSADYVGGPELGWFHTDNLFQAASPRIRRDLTVEAAVAVSGAVFASAMGRQNKGVEKLLAVSGARLGTWLPNPNFVRHLKNSTSSTGLASDPRPRVWPKSLPNIRGGSYLYREILGINDRDARLVQVTDGGHYDNSGLVEALRRRCRLIIVIDGGGDPPPLPVGLTDALRLARYELGVVVMLNRTAILATHKSATYVFWHGQRSRIDPADRSVTFNLGLDPGVTYPIEISNALFDAMPSTEPIVLPVIPGRGTPSRLLPGSIVGRVLQTRDASGTVNGLYVLLPVGVQKITSFVADLLRTADSEGSTTPTLVAPDKLIQISVVDVLDVDYYPSEKLEFVDTSANPATCVGWEKQTGDPQARITILSGRRLPIPIGMDSRVVRLVRDDRDPNSAEAQQTLLLPSAANFVTTTSGVATADSRESLYWISPQGVRYGIQSDHATLQALGLDPRLAVQAPWPIVRTFAPGPAIGRDAALVSRDTVSGSGAVAPIPDLNDLAGGG
ncbi:type VII secretion protein EccB [Mycobacterium genavense]|uniref:type VII secretion protein EccB n=1 Tax=Mycobacterium genavense TaxID=36812 RepID=UPI0004723859|nr:type VII secretion protein EccB [Mycobacterium genavense]